MQQSIEVTSNLPLKLIYSNADCLTNKRSELNAFLNSLTYKPDLIVITEINSKTLTNKMQECEFNLDGYVLYSKNIGKTHFRGVLIYCSDFLQSCEVELSSNFDEFLLIRIKQKDNCANLFIGKLL